VVLRRLIAGQVAISRRVDRLLPPVYRQDGHRHFVEAVVPGHLRPGARIYDVGGGKRPYLTPAAKASLGAHVVGVDIDPVELSRAPAGAYDRAVAADIAAFRGEGDADLVVCQTVLEHVRDVDGAVRAMATILKPGGTALIFVPCRNAPFARLNLLLPERLKRDLLFAVDPDARHAQGFPSFYRDCTPSALSRLARRHGLDVVGVTTYWMSAYFHPFLPAYAVWRVWTVVARTLDRRDCCESFALVLRRPDPRGRAAG